jgi:hypothetical protein
MRRQLRSENGPQSRNGERFLEQPSQSNEIPDPNRILEGQLRECYGRAVYSHKTHEKCADLLLKQLSRIKISQIVLSALTTGGFISTFLGAGNSGAAAGVIVSTILLILNAYTKNYDLGELAQRHKQSAMDIWLIREKYLSLLTDLAMRTRSLEVLQKERDMLTKALHGAYVGSPSTTFVAYKKAQQALQHHEDMTFSDDEIDAFLPPELKRGQR